MVSLMTRLANAADPLWTWQTVYGWFRELARRFLFQTIHEVALMLDREWASREASPSAGVIDCQSVKAPHAKTRGYDVGKKIVAMGTNLIRRNTHPYLMVLSVTYVSGPDTLFYWRTGWDSNPRSPCRLAAFRVRCHRPLDHLSAGGDKGGGRPRQDVLYPWEKAPTGPPPARPRPYGAAPRPFGKQATG